ncbi:ABC transporter permease [Methylobacillus gramineus]|uniref:MlaE family ABC transporter permease n=1 Tax=Methylobacillus gramineus TaxID=755169 RepID=UPI001CFF59EB|nr:ABC transporter permease [Methylobacillus gramineus]MCB5186080.1 ABC transporter permease [Methylobacillus gramineus]
MAAASFQVDQDAQGRRHIVLQGQWSLRALENDFAKLKKSLQPIFSDPLAQWDLTQVEQLDTAGAAVLWAGWQGKIDGRIALTETQTAIFDTLAQIDSQTPKKARQSYLLNLIAKWGTLSMFVSSHVWDFVRLLGLLVMELGYLLRRPQDFPWREFSANIYKSGITALPVTALLGFMIGVAMSYLMATQLRAFGADIFIVNILGLAIIRELGPILMAVLVAGRSGSAMTAQIGVMRVTEEIDALATMGISRILRVVLPKVLGLTFIAPMLVIWTSLWALFGGALSANTELGLGFRFFFDYLAAVVQPVNLTLSLIKGLMFGFIVALVACHFGLRIKPNTESLSLSTTSSVVTAITCVILIDAGFAILTSGIGV